MNGIRARAEDDAVGGTRREEVTESVRLSVRSEDSVAVRRARSMLHAWAWQMARGARKRRGSDEGEMSMVVKQSVVRARCEGDKERARTRCSSHPLPLSVPRLLVPSSACARPAHPRGAADVVFREKVLVCAPCCCALVCTDLRRRLCAIARSAGVPDDAGEAGHRRRRRTHAQGKSHVWQQPTTFSVA